MDRFSKICLGLIVVLLAGIFLHSVTAPQPTSAADKYQYLVVQVNTKQTSVGEKALQIELDKEAAEGWELVSAFYGNDLYIPVTFIFRKKA